MTLKKLNRINWFRSLPKLIKRGLRGLRIWYNSSHILDKRKRKRGSKAVRVGILTHKRNYCILEAQGHQMSSQLMILVSTSDPTLEAQMTNLCFQDRRKGWNQTSVQSQTTISLKFVLTNPLKTANFVGINTKESIFQNQARRTWLNNPRSHSLI